MHRGPIDSRHTNGPTDPSWRSLAVCYALIAAAALLLWSTTNPLAGVAVATGALGLFVGARKTVPLVRRLSQCGGFVLDVTDDLQICVVRPSADGPC